MKYGPIILERERSGRILSWGIRFFLAAALTAAQTPQGSAPFALGCVAAAGGGAEGGAALLGALAGAMAFMDFAAALPYLAEGILILTAAAAFRISPALQGRRVMALTAGAMTLAVGGIYALQALSPEKHIAPAIASALLSALSAWFLWPLLHGEGGEALENSLLFALSAMLLAVVDLELWGLSPARAGLCLLLAYFAYDHGAQGGVAAGLGLGLTLDLCCAATGGAFTAACGLAGLLAGRCGDQSRPMAAGAFFMGTAIALLPASQMWGQPLLWESALACTLFLLLPRRAFGGKRIRRQEGAPLPAAALSAHLKQRLSKAAAAFGDLYECMSRTAPPSTEENPAIVFDRAAEKVCRGCALCDLCWQRDYTGTFNALNDATPTLLERGRVMAKDFPGYFSSRCIHLPDFIAAVNAELSAFLLRRQYRRQLEQTRRSAKGQYAQLSELLSATAAGLGEAVRAVGEADFACQVGAALRPKEGESVCGDTVVSFRTEDGRWCLLLADGMGSGEAARKESALTCRLLRQFLEAGIEPEAALKTLNTAMALRGAETGSYTTVDLCVCDSGGETAFYKFGAAPSYIKRRGTVRRISGTSLPVGLRGSPASPDVTRAVLSEGSFIVMVSDGVADTNRDEWLQDLLAGWEGTDPQTLAGLILSESIRRERLQDDCGIQVLYRGPSGTQQV